MAAKDLYATHILPRDW